MKIQKVIDEHYSSTFAGAMRSALKDGWRFVPTSLGYQAPDASSQRGAFFAIVEREEPAVELPATTNVVTLQQPKYHNSPGFQNPEATVVSVNAA